MKLFEITLECENNDNEYKPHSFVRVGENLEDIKRYYENYYQTDIYFRKVTVHQLDSVRHYTDRINYNIHVEDAVIDEEVFRVIEENKSQS